MGKELEWKFAASPDALARVERETAGDFQPVEMEAVYYDTKRRALSARRWALRLRRENGVSVACLKTPGEGRARGEWEARAASPEEAAAALVERGAPPELRELTQDGLEPICATRFTRRAALLDAGGARVELALDEGFLEGGGKTAPLCELEVEYKSGDPDAAGAFASSLAARYGLAEEPKSKFQRAAALANG